MADFSTLRTQFYNRGFENWNDAGSLLAECKRLLNEAMHQIHDEYDGAWPFLEATATGSAPLTISDLGTIESVWDSTNSRFLDPADRRFLIERYEDGPLDDTGTPAWFYVANGSVKVYPVASNSLSVRYWKVASDLSADGDTPLMPTRFHTAIVDLAVAAAHRLNSNEGEAQTAQGEAQRKVETMASRLLGGQQLAGPQHIAPLSGDDS